ncbi:MAG: PaaI family thioesterase [Anaerolineae bacterium]|nr:PaaI family thioesterase [Anaerolineae bacterium]
MTKLPNSLHCFVCGLENGDGLKLEFYKDGPDSVAAEYTVPAKFQGYPGVVHGGIVATMLDEIAGRVFMIDDPNRFMYTARLTTRYRTPVPTEKPLRLVGRIVKDRARLAESRAELYGPDGDLLADAEALLVSLPDGVLDEAEMELLGWRVYPDEETAV